MNEIKIIHGNCIDVLSNMDIDYTKTIFVSDPPYNIGYHYNEYSDKLSEKDYYTFLKNVFGNNKQVLIHYPEQLYKYSCFIGYPPEKVVSWVYNSNTAKQHRDIAFFGIKPNFRKVGQEYKNPKDKRIAKRISEGKTARLYDWWEINQVKNVSKEKTEHPCQIPFEVMRRIVGVLPDDYTIIDPFMGSGTTALACIEFGRNFIGLETDRLYYDISKTRITEKLGETEEKLIFSCE